MRVMPLLPLRAFYVLFLLILFSESQVKSQAYPMKLGYRRTMTPDWFGLNSQNMVRDGIWIAEPNILQHMPELHPRVIRFPGSDVANWWDWKKGWFVDDPEVPEKFPGLTPMPNTLENFKLLINATKAVPLFSLNMITSDLQYQLAMLKHTDSIGLQVKYIELGSEYYLASEIDSSIIYTIFPTAESYGSACTIWIDSIHHYFPKALVAAQGAFDRSGPARRLTWDTSMVKTLVGENAITYHHYFNASGTEANGFGDGLYTIEDLPEFMSRPFKAWNILATKDLPTVRAGREVWITEYNLQDTSIPVHGSWGHGLFVATQSLLYLESALIKHIYFYCMDGSAYGAYYYNTQGLTYGEGSIFIPSADPPKTTPWSLSAAGRTIDMISDAVNFKTAASPLTFEGIPEINIMDNVDSVTYPSVYGWQFSNNAGSSAILMNLTGTKYTINTSSVFPAGGTFTKLIDDPLDYVSDDSSITKLTGTFTTMITLLPYSLTSVTSTSVPAKPPYVKIHAMSATTFCEGDSVQLDAGGGFVAYQWSTGETTRKIWTKSSSANWVRVWKSVNGYYAVDTMHVIVNDIPDKPLVLNSAKDEFCLGDSVVLSVKKIVDGIAYKWSTGVIDSDLTVAAGGSYWVTATDNNGCSMSSDSRAITTYPLPTPVITPSGPIEMCSDDKVTLSTTIGYKNYTWSTSAHAATLKVGETGFYSVTVTDDNKCVGTSEPVSVIAHAVPTPVVLTVGPTSFCDGTSPTYLSTLSGYSYQWKKGANSLSGATNRKYYPVDGGSYNVTIGDDFGCNGKSSSVDITVHNLPSAHISITGSKNICLGQTRLLTASVGIGYSYQWTKDGTTIPGAVLFTYIAITAGDYECNISDGNGCDQLSNLITITSDCRSEVQQDASSKGSMIVYPNPATNELHVEVQCSDELDGNYILEVQNMLGVTLWKDEARPMDNMISSTISLNHEMANGTYLILARRNGIILHSQFVVAGH